MKNPQLIALFVESLNETIDLQTSRVAVLYYQIPGMIWVSFSVIVLISDLDRLSSEWLQVSNQPMVELRSDMNDAAHGR